MKSQKLSVYLIKEGLTNLDDIVKDAQLNQVFENGILFYKKSYTNQPSWTKNFFQVNIDELKSSAASGLFVTKINFEGKEIHFGLSFGHGWQMFKNGAFVKQFGIKTALSIVKDEIKKIEKKNFKNSLKDVSEQLGKIGSVADFGFDIEQDIMKAIVGEPIDLEMFGKNVVGKDAISLSLKKDIMSINDLLVNLYRAYTSNKYKEKFAWFDNFSTVKDRGLISNLDIKLINKINNFNSDRNLVTEEVIYWLAIPEVINWEATKCFKYSTKDKDPEYQDVIFSDFKRSFQDEAIIKIDTLKNKKVFQIGTNEEIIEQWSIYKCLYAEIDHNNEKFLLVSGNYYRVDQDYKDTIEREYHVDNDFTLPSWNKKEHESAYNKQVEESDSDYQCLDGGASQTNLIGRGRIEFADLVRADRYLVHVKKYGASSVLSHLFSQGLVSASLLLTDLEFRKEVNSKLKDSHKNIVSEYKPNPTDYTIVYAIGTTKTDLKLPFFSIINYRNVKKQLELYGFKILLVKINQI
jgi:uncharacterized protein (TIGR04141 family)